MLVALVVFLIVVGIALLITVGLAALGAIVSRRWCEEGPSAAERRAR
jgi:hypothetical protein